MKKSRRWLFFIPVICGVLLVVLLKGSRKPPERPEVAERSRSVHVIEVEKRSIIPRVVGYGYVQPIEVWQAIPEVSGKVVEIHPELKKGAFVTAGELLLRLDPETYGLAESRGKATVKSVDAQILELEQEKANTERLLKLERQSLKLAKNELSRVRGLHGKGVISDSDLEKEKQSYLAQQTKVDNLVNTLKLIPSRMEALLARKDSDVSSLSALQLDVEKTVIRAPFDSRISEVNIEMNQFASTGQVVLKAVNIAAVEIPVQLSPNDFVNLLSTSVDSSKLMTREFNMEMLREMINIKAEVRLPLFSSKANWEAEFRRTGDSIDLSTGAMTVYVAVQRPYDKVVPAVRPPLVPNMYCEVELQGEPRKDRYLIPIQALHEGSVYLLDEESRLERREVEVEMLMGNMAVINNGLSGKVTIITTDLIPAIDGQLLTPVLDSELMKRIQAIR